LIRELAESDRASQGGGINLRRTRRHRELREPITPPLAGNLGVCAVTALDLSLPDFSAVDFFNGKIA
jgi:hypothetical protein